MHAPLGVVYGLGRGKVYHTALAVVMSHTRHGNGHTRPRSEGPVEEKVELEEVNQIAGNHTRPGRVGSWRRT